MIDTVSVGEEFRALSKEHERRLIREAVEKARSIVEVAKERAKSESWRRSLERLVGKYWRRLPRTLVHHSHGGLRYPLEVGALSLDPADTKYWASHSQLYGPTRSTPRGEAGILQYVDGAVLDKDDLPSILEVLEVVRERDLSSQVFIPRGTALFEYQSYIKAMNGYDSHWSDYRSRREMYARDIETAVVQACYHLTEQRGVETVREARIYMPGLNQVFHLEVDRKLVSLPAQAV